LFLFIKQENNSAVYLLTTGQLPALLVVSTAWWDGEIPGGICAVIADLQLQICNEYRLFQ